MTELNRRNIDGIINIILADVTTIDSFTDGNKLINDKLSKAIIKSLSSAQKELDVMLAKVSMTEAILGKCENNDLWNSCF